MEKYANKVIILGFVLAIVFGVATGISSGLSGVVAGMAQYISLTLIFASIVLMMFAGGVKLITNHLRHELEAVGDRTAAKVAAELKVIRQELGAELRSAVKELGADLKIDLAPISQMSAPLKDLTNSMTELRETMERGQVGSSREYNEMNTSLKEVSTSIIDLKETMKRGQADSSREYNEMKMSLKEVSTSIIDLKETMKGGQVSLEQTLDRNVKDMAVYTCIAVQLIQTPEKEWKIEEIRELIKKTRAALNQIDLQRGGTSSR